MVAFSSGAFCIVIALLILLAGAGQVNFWTVHRAYAQEQNNSYLYGCTFYSTTQNHCDPILSTFQSNYTAASLIQKMRVPGHPSFVNSKYNSALQMQASSLDLVQIDSKSYYNNTKFSVYLVVQPANTENILGSLVSYRSEYRNSGWELLSVPTNSSSSVVRFTLFNTNGDAQSSEDVSVPSGKFLEIVGTFDGTDIKLYVDGELKSTSHFNGSFSPAPRNSLPLTVSGGAYCHCSTVTAAYDELRIYNRSLNAQEVSQITSSAGNPNPLILGGLLRPQQEVTGLVGQWKFDGDLTDSSQYHNDAHYVSLVSSMVTMPDGRVLFGEKNSGNIDVLDSNGNLMSKPFATISPIHVGWEEGLLGLTLDDNYTSTHHVYAYYNYQDPDTGKLYARLVRLTDNNGVGIDMQVLYDKIPASNGFHTGGALRFNPIDHKLYVFVGDETERNKAQDLGTLNGKLLRLNSDGSVPDDNPFPGSPIFSYGFRNAYGLAFDPNGNGILAESREDLYDQIDYIQKGGNYGWPTMSPPNEPSELFTNNSAIKPIRSYYIPPSPTEAIFYTGDKFPELKNSFVFGSSKGDLFSLKLSNSTHALKSELRLFLHLYPYEPIVSIAQLQSGDILIGGYNIYQLTDTHPDQQRTGMYAVRVNSTNADIGGMSYRPDQKLITIDVPSASGNNTVLISLPVSMLSSAIQDVAYQANTTLANDGSTNVSFPYSERTQQVGNMQTVFLQFPGSYSQSDNLQILIDYSGASVTKNVPEFGQLAVVTSLAAVLASIIGMRRVHSRLRPG